MEGWIAWQRCNPFVADLIAQGTTTHNALVRDALWGQQPPTKWALMGIVLHGENLIRTSRYYWGEEADCEPRHQRLVSKVFRGYEQVRERVERAEKVEAYLSRLADAKPSVSDPPGPKPGVGSQKGRVLQLADEIMNSGARPQFEHGWKERLAEAIWTQLQADRLPYKIGSIRRYLSEHQIKHPDES
jgi:hypothetical protein